jgi:hypothetical protein
MLNTTPYYSWQATSGDVVTNYDLIIATHPPSIPSVSPTITVDRLFIFVFVWDCVPFEWWKASWHVQLSCSQNIQLSHDQNSWTCLPFLYVIVPLYKFSFGFGSNRKELMILYVLKTNEDSFRSAMWTYGFDRTMFTLEIFYGFDAGGFHWINGFDVQCFPSCFTSFVWDFETLKKIVCICLDLLTCQWNSLPFCTWLS